MPMVQHEQHQILVQNQLIRAGAILVTQPGEILQELGLNNKNQSIRRSKLPSRVPGTGPAGPPVPASPPTALLPAIVALVIDRPYLFLIRDRQTGEILFEAQVVDPAQS